MCLKCVACCVLQMRYYIFKQILVFIFTEGVSVVYLGFLNIHILCAGGDLAISSGGPLIGMSVSV